MDAYKHPNQFSLLSDHEIGSLDNSPKEIEINHFLQDFNLSFRKDDQFEDLNNHSIAMNQSEEPRSIVSKDCSIFISTKAYEEQSDDSYENFLFNFNLSSNERLSSQQRDDLNVSKSHENLSNTSELIDVKISDTNILATGD